jgi:outer membrane protein assembly factor BamE (lipoprotein component of BamABCDE complex)
MRCSLFFLLLLGLSATACSVERAEVASEAQNKIVGMSNEQVLACMGAPERQATVGDTEVWSYISGGDTSTFGNATGSANETGHTNVFGSSHSIHRYCVVNIVMRAGRVAAVHYTGRTGGLLTQGEECAFAVENCIQ